MDLKIGDKVIIRHPLERLNGLTGVVLMRKNNLYSIELHTGERADLSRCYLVSKQYHETVNAVVSLQYLYETTGFMPEHTEVKPIN